VTHNRLRAPTYAVGAGLLALLLAACGVPESPSAQRAAPTRAIATATIAVAPTLAAPTPQDVESFEYVSGSGEITTAHDASLVFLAQGQVLQVLVEEGQAVTQGQMLAVLDTRPFDLAVQQAEAGLAGAQAQQALLDEKPRAADVQAAGAQIQQAQIALAQARTGQTQDVRGAEAALAAAQAQTQNARDQLSLAKTGAEAQMNQAALALTQAQALYSQAKSSWEYVQETGKDPIQPTVTNATTGKKADNKLSDGAREAYYSQYVQAEAAMRQAEQAMAQAQATYDTARQAEVNGVQAAEQQLTQSQAAIDKVRVPAGEDRAASAQAALKLAQANLARLRSDPNPSQRKQVAAGVAAAEAALAQAQLNRAYAELRAPFDGVVAQVGIEAGEIAGPAGQPAVKLLDVGSLRFEAPIADGDIAHVELGQRAEVRLDALPGQVLLGKVSFINPAADASGSVRTYTVRVTLDEPARLRIGMSGVVILLQ
jgi:HlyD family secretion protein